MKFEIKKFDAAGRLGQIIHNNKMLKTPNILPVVSPFENVIPPRELLEKFDVSALFTNAYILYNNKEKAQIAEKKGIHSYLGYKGLIATDSGAFQHYMYGTQNDITAEEIEVFQERINSDFPVILDVPVQLTDSKIEAQDKMKLTIQRARENIARRSTTHGAWYGPIQGTRYPDVLKESCLNMNSLDFGVYAVGGIVKAMNEYAFDVCVEAFLTVNRYIRKDKPIHMFGLGLPQFFSLAVACGADLMDSAAYILFAKQGRYFTLEGTKHIVDLSELPCYCPICTSYTVKEINTLYKKGKKTKRGPNRGIELIARHNMYVTMGEIRNIREAIRSGSLWDLVEQRVQSHPKLLKAYKKIWDHKEDIERSIPLEKRKGQSYLGNTSLSRPIFYRMSSKVQKINKFTVESIILLIPELQESLFNSQYGRHWINKIEMIKKSTEFPIEPMIVSSFFGLIPLDLYGIYPFSQRDWVEPSKNVIETTAYKAILKYVSQNKVFINKILIYNPDLPEHNSSQFFKEFLSRILENNIKKKWGEIIVIKDLEEIKDYCS